MVNPIKNQGQCGSCWAFTATAVLETVYKMKKGVLPVLSEQDLVDCSSQNYGCDGGWYDTAWDQIKLRGIAANSTYPYTAREGTCKSTSTSNPRPYTLTAHKQFGTVQNWVTVGAKDADIMRLVD